MQNNTELEPKVVGNMSAAATLLGITYSDVQRAKNLGCPAFHPSGRVNVPALREWLLSAPIERDYYALTDCEARLQRSLTAGGERWNSAAAKAQMATIRNAIDELYSILPLKRRVNPPQPRPKIN